MFLKNITKCSSSSKLMEFLWMFHVFVMFCPSMQMSLTQVPSPTLPGLPTCPPSWTWRSLPEVDVECPAWRVPVFGKITAIPTGWIYNIYIYYIHTHVLHPIAATATATTTIIITTVAMWLCSAGSDGYTLIAERVSHSATNFRVTSFFENTLVLRDKNMPNAPQIEPLSWKCIYIYLQSIMPGKDRKRIQNNHKSCGCSLVEERNRTGSPCTTASPSLPPAPCPRLKKCFPQCTAMVIRIAWRCYHLVI